MIPLWIVFALLSAIIFSAKDIIVKKLFNHHEMTPVNAVMQEYFGYILITLIFIPFINFQAIISQGHLFLLKAILVGTMSYIYFQLLEKHTISSITPLLNLSPAVLLLLSSVFLGEVISNLQVGGILLIIAATYYLEVVLIHHKTQQTHKKHWYLLKKKSTYFFGTIIAMLIISSLVAITDKMILSQVNWQTNLFFTAIIVLIVYTIVKKPSELKNSLQLFKKHPLSIIYAITNVTSTIFILLAIAIPESLVALVIPLRRTSTLFTSIFGGLLFHEDHLIKKMMSISVMLIGIVLIVL